MELSEMVTASSVLMDPYCQVTTCSALKSWTITIVTDKIARLVLERAATDEHVDFFAHPRITQTKAKCPWFKGFLAV
jgi:hypothetical protein